MVKPTKSVLRKKAASLMGQARTEAKKKAARKNGELGGRPVKYGRCPNYKYHRFHPGLDRCPCGYVRASASM